MLELEIKKPKCNTQSTELSNQMKRKLKELYNSLIVVGSIASDEEKNSEEKLQIISQLTNSQLSKADNFIF
jgi:hypothetical protein